METSKSQIENAYNVLINRLEIFSEQIESIDGINSKFDDIQNSFVEEIDQKIKDAKQLLQECLNETVWDNLVIAFFGETNAGKSTIIETFRILFDDSRTKEDGLIVGDGRQDFTKVYEEYKLCIDGHPFTLIDVPGIEGNEAEFKDGIKKALHKAHYVFYVQGHNKKPDTKTAEKIKEYLGDWVKVYSIYNVRGGTSNYDEEEEREMLLAPNILKTESLIKESFQETLGAVYSGNLTIQALLAMCAKGQFSKQREDLLNKQIKLLKYFGGADAILKFSQFQTIINLVSEKAKNFTFEIVEANKQKMISLVNSINYGLKEETETQSKNTAELKELLQVFRRDVVGILGNAKRNIENKTQRVIDSQFSQLKNNIFNIIDNDDIDDKKHKAQGCQARARNNIAVELFNVVSQELNNAKKRIEDKRKSLDGMNMPQIHIPSFSYVGVNIDFEGALENLDISFDDVAEWFAKTAGTASLGAVIGSVGGPLGSIIGAGVGTLVGGVVHAVTGDGGKSDARNEVSNAVEEAKRKCKRKLESSIYSIRKGLDKQEKNISDSVYKELGNIKRMENMIGEVQKQLKEYIDDIKNTNYGTIRI